MPFVSVSPDVVTTAASSLSELGSSISAANVAAALPTTVVAAAGTDEISVAVAALFGGYAREYQVIGARVAGWQEQFVVSLHTASGAYAAAEAAAANPLQSLLDVLNAPSVALTGRVLIGDGADATTAGGNGATGGWLYGNGGNGAPGAPGQAGGNGGAAGLIGTGGTGGAGGASASG
ncbi:MAG: PE family protein, partial [Mycobacterium gordonae]|nr:PE family protein [Mycobacterium gordonae]